MAFILAAASTLALIFWPCRLFGKYGFIVRYPEKSIWNLNPTLDWNFLATLGVDDRRQSFLISFWVGKEANLGRNCGAKNGHYSRLNCPSGDKRSFKGRWFLCSFRFWRLVVVRRTLLVCVIWSSPFRDDFTYSNCSQVEPRPKKNFCHLHFFKWPHTDFLLDRIILLYFFSKLIHVVYC